METECILTMVNTYFVCNHIIRHNRQILKKSPKNWRYNWRSPIFWRSKFETQDRCYKNLQKIGESPKIWRYNWRSPIFWRSKLETQFRVGPIFWRSKLKAQFREGLIFWQLIGIKGFVVIKIYKPISEHFYF